MRLNGETRLHLIIGDPVAQVKSPENLTGILAGRGVNAIVAPAHVTAADLSAFIETLLQGLEVSLSSPVSRVAYDDTGVSLRLGTGESLSFDRVVLTVPLGVLQHGGVEFSPALPFTHRGAIADLGVGAIETIWLRFDEAFWETEAALWHVVGGDAVIRTWFNLQPTTGEPVLVGLVGGDAAEEFAALGDQEAVVAALTSLAPFMPSADAE